ncbi:MAG: hypothetical protein WC877_06790 [Dehalococcoidales bacterium]
MPKRAIINISDLEMREFNDRRKPYDPDAIRHQKVIMSVLKRGLEVMGYAVTVRLREQSDSTVDISDMTDDAAEEFHRSLVESITDFDAVEIDEEVREEIDVMTS